MPSVSEGSEILRVAILSGCHRLCGLSASPYGFSVWRKETEFGLIEN